MNSKELFLGGWVNALMILVSILSLGGDEMNKTGYIISVIIMLSFSSIVRTVLGNATKNDSPSDWKAIGSYIFGATISSIIAIVLYLIANIR